MRKLYLMAIASVLTISIAGKAAAEIYSYKDENGVTHFTNTPPSSKYKPLDLWQNDAPPAPFVYQNPSFDPIIEEAAAFYKLDPAMIKAVIKVESNFNKDAVSKKGAMGLMQLMPGTAARFGVSDPFNPIENIWAGTYYMKWLIVKFNYNYDWAFAGYNAGENAVVKYNGIPPYKETRGYVKKVNYYWRIYRGGSLGAGS